MEDTVSKRSVSTLVASRRPSLVPPMWEDAVRVVPVSEHKAAGMSLAHAFATDDLSRYLVDADDMLDYTAEQKWKIHTDIMMYLTSAHCYGGLVTTIGPEHDAVALWVPPGKNIDGWWTSFRSGLWRLNFELPPLGRKRFYHDFMPLLHHTKEEVMGERDEDCYYLVYIGTKPNSRRKGYAQKLIEDMAERADAEGRAIYLESSSQANNLYYTKFSFEFKKDIYFPQTSDDAPPVTLSIMVREPQPQPVRKGGYDMTLKVRVAGLPK